MISSSHHIRPIHYIHLAALLFLILQAGAVQAKNVTGVDVADSLSAGDTELVLNGAGARTKVVIKVYVAGLYLANKSQDAESIMAANEPMALRIYVTSKLLTAKRLSKALRDGFKKSTRGNTAPVQPGIDRLEALLGEDVKKGRNFTLMYLPGEGTQVYSDEDLLDTIEGLDFKRALFGIWISDSPAQKSLKSNLLGQ